jgi:hypothetical protein
MSFSASIVGPFLFFFSLCILILLLLLYFVFDIGRKSAVLESFFFPSPPDIFISHDI